MKFGICTSIDNASAVRSAGWDYVEIPAIQVHPSCSVIAPLPVRACNQLVPPTVKITGPNADFDRLVAYLADIIDGAANVEVSTLVLGSGAARRVDGFDRIEARRQIIKVARAAGEMAARKQITVALEPLNRAECDIINTIGEAADYVREVDHPNFRLLLDTSHFWMENDSHEDLADAMPLVAHVHVADKDGRVPPGESGNSDYRPLFRILKSGGYDQLISGEGNFPGRLIRERGAAILDYLKREWQES